MVVPYKLPTDWVNEQENPIYTQFFKSLFTTNISGALGDYSPSAGGIPDISGYTMVYLLPPALSGLQNPSNALPSTSYGLGYGQQQFDPSVYLTMFDKSRHNLFLIQDITPPESQITTNDISSTSNIKIPYAVGSSTGGNLNLSFLENATLDIYSFHHLWFHYIDDVRLGHIDPHPTYIQNNLLDYTTSIYVLKYKPDLCTLTYFAKAIGLFPISLPIKDVIGSRGNHQTTIYTIPYICADYQDIILSPNLIPSSGAMSANRYLLADIAMIYSVFGLLGSLT